MSALAIFSFENSQVRTLGTAETPLFVAIDVAAALGYSQPAKSVNDRVDHEDIIKAEIETKGGRQTVNCVNESGLYALIFGSKLESAKRFKRWVTNEVLPAIRKTGTYTRTSVPAQSPIGQAIAPAIAVSPITDVQYAELTAAVRAKASGSDRSAAYSRLRARFRVVSLRQIPEARFQEALEWVRQYRVPVKALPAPKTTTGRPVLTHDIGEARGLKMMSGVKAIIGIGDDGLPFAQVIKNQVLVCPTSAEHICAMLELVPDAVIPDILRICTNRIAGMRRLTN